MSDENKTKWKARNFLFTLNDVDKFEALKDYLTHYSTFIYGIASKEKAPITGHEHIHIYCQYNDRTTLSGKKLQGAHIDICRGSAQQNIDYVRKTYDPAKRGEIIWEEGTPKHKGGYSIKEVKLMSQEDREFLPMVYYKSVTQINAEEDIHVDINSFFKQVEVRYIYGGSGLGKTFFAQTWLKELNIKLFDVVSFGNGFWMGVSETSNFALYDDFRDKDMPAVEFVKFIDYTIKTLNVKRGFIKNKYKYIAITSIQDPRFIFDKEWEEKTQWLRRIRVFHFYGYKQYKELTDGDLGIEVYE